MEGVKRVSHEQAVTLLHNKFVVVLGDSIQRGVYKDLVKLLQKDKYLSANQLRSKGELSFEQDCLVEGGSLGNLHNGTEYREVRQYQSDHHLVRFYFITRIYSPYVRSILSDFRRGPKPDVVVLNSCVWDISRYNSGWMEDYQENLHKFFDELNGVLPMESLVIWNVTMPVAEKIKGGFLVAEIQHKAAQLRFDVIEANFYAGTLADGYGLDVLDLHFEFRFHLQHRTKDGVHWNAVAHRKISWLLLQHTARAWGVTLPAPVTAVEIKKQERDGKQQKREENRINPLLPRIEAPIRFPNPPPKLFSSWGSVALLPVTPMPRAPQGSQDYIGSEPWHWSNAHQDQWSRAGRSDSWRPDFRRTDATEDRHQYVMKRRQRHHYAPYSPHRPHRQHHYHHHDNRYNYY